MSLDNIDFTSIKKSTLIVSYPFEYDKNKILEGDGKAIVKFSPETLLDFLPYTQKNFFGAYHFSDKTPVKISIPSVLKSNEALSIHFHKDKKIAIAIEIDKIEIFIFENGIALLTLSYVLPDNLTQEEYLYYHHKLTHIGKRSKQNIVTSKNKEYKYYHEFIDDLLKPYTLKVDNVFSRVNLYSYNVLVAKYCNNTTNMQNFLEPLTQYRTKLDEIETVQLNASIFTQTANIHTISNENVTIHVAIEKDNIINDFIENDFFEKYLNNHFLTYLISIYQVSKLTQLINRAFLKGVESQDINTMRDIKMDILYFVSNGNFTKISNNSIRNNLYKFYRKVMDLKEMLDEVNTVSEKISSELERKQNDKQNRMYKRFEIALAFIGALIGVIGLLITLK